MFHFNHKQIYFKPAGPDKIVLYDEGAMKIQTVCLAAGQAIPPCAMSTDVLFHVLKGNGILRVDGEQISLTPGETIVVPARAASRSIAAETDLALLAVQVRPVEAEH
jgi:quercetin dioxygenase-like cupin family protein